MTFEAFSAGLAATPVSQAIQASFWVVPTVQAVHIMAICALASSALVLDLRLIAGRGEPVAAYGRRYLPWIWAPLIVLLLTGLTMIAGEPDRTLFNRVFWTKMGILAAALLVTLAIQAPMARDAQFWEDRTRRVAALALALLSIILWALVIICGRWIAYVE